MDKLGFIDFSIVILYLSGLVALFWGFFMIANLGIFLWTSAMTLKILAGWPMWVSILATAFVIGFYTLAGGLRAVVFTDTIPYFYRPQSAKVELE